MTTALELELELENESQSHMRSLRHLLPSETFLSHQIMKVRVPVVSCFRVPCLSTNDAIGPFRRIATLGKFRGVIDEERYGVSEILLYGVVLSNDVPALASEIDQHQRHDERASLWHEDIEEEDGEGDEEMQEDRKRETGTSRPLMEKHMGAEIRSFMKSADYFPHSLRVHTLCLFCKLHNEKLEREFLASILDKEKDDNSSPTPSSPSDDMSIEESVGASFSWTDEHLHVEKSIRKFVPKTRECEICLDSCSTQQERAALMRLLDTTCKAMLLARNERQLSAHPRPHVMQQLNDVYGFLIDHQFRPCANGAFLVQPCETSTSVFGTPMLVVRLVSIRDVLKIALPTDQSPQDSPGSSARQ